MPKYLQMSRNGVQKQVKLTRKLVNFGSRDSDRRKRKREHFLFFQRTDSYDREEKGREK